jgi:CO/xanthine dehydrogenase FAD-binding subunit
LGAEDFKEAVNALVSGRKGAILLAGGIDLFVNMKYKVIQSKQIINLKTIPKLEALVEAEESIQVI